MINWKMGLTSYGQALTTIDTKGGIFQPLIFIISLVPMTKILRKVAAGYMLDNDKVDH